MRAKVRLLIAAVVAVGLCVGAVVWQTRPDDGPTTASSGPSSDEAVAPCLGATLRDDAAGPCRALLEEFDEPDAARVDVLVLVPESSDADRTIDLVTTAVDMWSKGRAAAAEAVGETVPEVRVRADVVDAGAAVHPLLDPEIVFVAADEPDEAGETSKDLDLYEPSGTRCAVFDDAFSLDTWRSRQGFASHHRLPEGTYVEDCGSGGGPVCFAVNATLDGSAVGVDPFEAYTSVSDEFAHCLEQSTTR